jgi:UDP-GlcNAc:undecaprenyl-phosphate/decaprenyl-phosphate GlcNAc-1-phosphate transferase
MMSAELLSATTFSTAIVGGALGTFGVRAVAVKIGFVSTPNPIVPQHIKPVAYLGGVGVSIGVAVMLASLAFVGVLQDGVRTVLSIGLPALLFLGLGIVDDLRRFSAAPKFVAQVVIALVAISLDVVFSFTGNGFIDGVLSTFLMLVLVNAFNLVDVCDGLLAGLCVIVFVVLSRINPPFALVSLSVAGACAGFLVFNFPPASIFLGDAGSHVLGFLAAALVLTGGGDTPAGSYWLTALLALTVPLFELGFLIAVRTRKGISWFKGSPDHFSLRLQVAGLTRKQTVGLAWSVSVMFSGIAWVASLSSTAGQVALLVLTALLLSAAAVLLLRWEVESA